VREGEREGGKEGGKERRREADREGVGYVEHFMISYSFHENIEVLDTQAPPPLPTYPPTHLDVKGLILSHSLSR